MEDRKAEGAKERDFCQDIRDYIGRNLPAPYTSSPLYTLVLTREGAAYRAEVSLDMAADGSDFAGFGEDERMIMAEMEAGFLLSSCLPEPPAPVDFLLRMQFEDGEEIQVERLAGQDVGTLAWGAARMGISFAE